MSGWEARELKPTEEVGISFRWRLWVWVLVSTEIRARLYRLGRRPNEARCPSRTPALPMDFGISPKMGRTEKFAGACPAGPDIAFAFLKMVWFEGSPPNR